MNIFNLTQHPATEEQRAVFEPSADNKTKIKELLTFHIKPDTRSLQIRARELVEFVPRGFDCALIGGAPYLMAHLERELRKYRKVPMYSFSERVSEEHTDEKGNIIKTNVFKHKGYIKGI